MTLETTAEKETVVYDRDRILMVNFVIIEDLDKIRLTKLNYYGYPSELKPTSVTWPSPFYYSDNHHQQTAKTYHSSNNAINSIF